VTLFNIILVILAKPYKTRGFNLRTSLIKEHATTSRE
jgi:hypothetical protein